jgi:alpha-tubulin suppressor-like RCC1 family protein
MSKQLEVSCNKPLDFSQGVQDAIDYMRSISNRLLSVPGNTLTFGSGDCGQAGHGMEEDADLMVPYPRPVAALNTKKVVFVACGGLHNAVTTQDGQVFTWGCSDDGSLGRYAARLSYVQ